MNESDIEIGRVLLQFDEIVEEHNSYLEELENMLEFPTVDRERLVRLLKRLRRTRKEILNGINSISNHINSSNDSKIKEEALGLMNYFYVVGLNDEEIALRKVLTIDVTMKEEIENDLLTLERIKSLVMQFIY